MNFPPFFPLFPSFFFFFILLFICSFLHICCKRTNEKSFPYNFKKKIYRICFQRNGCHPLPYCPSVGRSASCFRTAPRLSARGFSAPSLLPALLFSRRAAFGNDDAIVALDHTLSGYRRRSPSRGGVAASCSSAPQRRRCRRLAPLPRVRHPGGRFTVPRA